MKPSAFSFQLSALLLALVISASAQQPTNVQKGGAAGTNNITADLNIGTGRTLTIASGGTLTIAAGATATIADGSIAWADVSKTGSSLADLTTRSATDLTSGTLDNARLDSDLQTFAGITPSANVQSLLGAADYSAMRTQLGLVIGTNVQAYDADLLSWAGVTRAAGFDTFTATPSGANLASLLTTALPASKGGTGLTALSANVVSLLGAADYSAMRTQLGLVIGTNVQAYDADLDDLADGSLTGTKVAAATTSAQGAVELATTAETLAGTDTARANTPAGSEARALQGDLTRPVKDALYSDDVTSARRVEWTPGTAGAVAAMPITLLHELKVPTSNPPSLSLRFFDVGPSGDPTVNVTRFSGLITTSGVGIIGQIGATLSDTRLLTYAGFRAAYSGQWVRLAVVFTAGDSTTAPLIYANGVDITASFTPSTAGTPPNWMPSTLDTTKFYSGYNHSAGRFIPHGPILGALTAAEVLEWTQTGRLPAWCEIGTGSAVAKYTSDFSAGVNGWSAEGSATLTADTANNRLDFTWAGSGTSRIVRYSVWGEAGKRYRLTFDITNFTGGNVSVIDVASGAASFGTVNGNGSYAFDGTLNVVPVGLSFLRTDALGSATVANFKITELGPIFKPVIQPGVVLRDAGSNNLPGLLTSGITPITMGDRGAFTATLTWAGTHEAKSLLGTQAIPSNAIITRIWRKATVSSSGSGCTIGTTNSATRWQALDTYNASAEISTLANQLPAGTTASDLDIVVDPDTANYTGSITVTVEYQIVGGTP